MTEFQKLVRFVDTNGTIRYGEAPDSDVKQGDTVPIYAGDVPWSLSATENKAQIGKVTTSTCYWICDTDSAAYRFYALCHSRRSSMGLA